MAFRAGSFVDRRRFLRAAGAATGAGIAGLAWPSASAANQEVARRRTRPAPNPIPGGIELAPGVVTHVFAPGDPGVTLPYTGITLQGLDYEPSTITDFNGVSAVAYHIGTARAGDGTAYHLETDIRAFHGEYVVDGEARLGSFALVSIDLFDPGSAAHVHDFNGGILPSGLVWTFDVGRTVIDFSMNGRRAVLHVRNVPLIDTFQSSRPSATPAVVEFRAEWRATGPAVQVGMGTQVAPTSPHAFLGEIARAESIFAFSAEEIGFESVGRGTTSPAGYAQIGTERNGIFV